MRKRTSITAGVVLSVTLGCASSILAQATQWEERLEHDLKNRELLLNLGRYYHDLGGNREDRNAVKKAEEYLSRLLEIEPENGVALVYYGSVLTMKARDTFFPWNKMKYMQKGFARMDKAVYFEPNNPEVRLIRGINSTNVPDMFHRLTIALEDFERIENLGQETLSHMTNKFWLPYCFYYGLALCKDESFQAAREKLQKAVALDSVSAYAQKAREELEKIEEQTHGNPDSR